MSLGKSFLVPALGFLLVAGLLISQPHQERISEDWLLRLIAQPSEPEMRLVRARAAQQQFNQKWNDVFGDSGAAEALYIELESHAANPKSFERVDKAFAVLQADAGWLHKDKRR
jgi:hypothetical protein